MAVGMKCASLPAKALPRLFPKTTMRLKLKLPNHPNPSHAISTSQGDYTIVYSRQPNPRGEVMYAIRAVSGLRIDMTAYYPMAELEARMATGIQFFSPGRRVEIASIVEALIRDGLATESTDVVPSKR